MATTKKGIMGPFSGKVGPVVGSNWKGISYIKAVPIFRGEKRAFSAAQLANQAKFKYMNQWLEPFYPYVAIGFAHLAKASTEINAAFKWNYQEALIGVYPDFMIQYDKVRLSKGKLPGLKDLNIQLMDTQVLQLHWAPKGNNGVQSDQLMLVVYSPDLGFADGCIGLAKRSDAAFQFTFSAKLIGYALEVYVSMVGLYRKSVSDSQYVGKILP